MRLTVRPRRRGGECGRRWPGDGRPGTQLTFTPSNWNVAQTVTHQCHRRCGGRGRALQRDRAPHGEQR
ncbi:MAG: hypothetical protein R3A10_23055 [Caldilineaceae bacterium]